MSNNKTTSPFLRYDWAARSSGDEDYEAMILLDQDDQEIAEMSSGDYQTDLSWAKRLCRVKRLEDALRGMVEDVDWSHKNPVYQEAMQALGDWR